MSELPELLVRFRPDLLRYVERHAGSVLRFETAEDLVQGVHLRALSYQSRFTFRGREPFLKWLYEVSRNHVATRKAHWSALKRRPRAILRLTQGAGTNPDPRGVAEPAGAGTGPSTLAGRLEEAALAVRALDLLLERDRALVRWAGEGTSAAEIAERLQISAGAAERARQRAVERFRKAYRLLRTR